MYIDRFQPTFEPLKSGHFDSSWNWVLQDTLTMVYDIIFDKLTTVDLEFTARCIPITNSADATAAMHAVQHRMFIRDGVRPTGL